jgi:hypothetical protein
MLTRIIIMRPGEPQQKGEVDLPAEPSLGELHAVLRPLLDGGDPEHLQVYTGAVPWLGEAGFRDMFVDDEGHARLWEIARDGVGVSRTRGGKNLPRNDAATELYLRNVRLHEPEQPDDPGYFIVGPAVLFVERRVWF